MHQSELFEMLQGADDAAIVVDEAGLICFWNESAERLLGFSAADALNKECWALLDGCDSSGTRVCTNECPVAEFSRHNSRISSFDLHITAASGARKWVNVSVIVVRTRKGQMLIHLMRDIDARHRLESLTKEIIVRVGGLTGLQAEQILQPARARPAAAVPLTNQEIKILRSLSLGRSTAAIGRELKVSQTTVRNHVGNILRKLGVHTRLEAVMCALKRGLI